MKFTAELPEKYKFEIGLVNLAALFYLFRIVIPLFKYPFLLLYIFLLGYSMIKHRNNIFSTFIEFIRNYYIILILALILVISFLTSNKLYLLVFKDLANMVVLLSLFYLSTLLGHGKKEIQYYISNLIYLITVFASVISILGILNFLGIISMIEIPQISSLSGDVSATQISLDYNFAVLPSFFGIMAIFFYLSRSISKLKILAYNIFLFIFSINILLSGSRRGLLLFIGVLAFLFFIQFFRANRKLPFLRNLAFDSQYFLICISLLTVISYSIIFYANYSFKIRILETIGTKNIPAAKHMITQKLLKYFSVIKNQKSYVDFYARIWPQIPEDPDSGWGTRPHKTIFPLTGDNSSILPRDARGYLLDNTSTAEYYETVDLCESYTLLENINVQKGSIYKASVYCFASDNFDGNRIGLGVRYDAISKGVVFGKTETSYDFQKKGSWQKLEIEFQCNNGEVPVLMSFTKNGVKNLSKLNGYVIFAFPQCEKIDYKVNVELSTISHKENYFRNECFKYIKGTAVILPQKSNFELSGLMYFPISKILTSFLHVTDTDPIRRWASKFISEDTTYFPYKSKINLDIIENPFVADRYLRWEFALKIFLNEYSLKQKIFGGGFNFLNWFGHYFFHDKTQSDYPHNPFLHILLYSGIVGLLLYCFFLYKVFYYYIKYIKEYPLFYIFFLITLFFSFFSSGCPFDPPLLGFFSIVPFYIHALHKKDNKYAESIILDKKNK